LVGWELTEFGRLGREPFLHSFTREKLPRMHGESSCSRIAVLTVYLAYEVTHIR